jgi:hypothetical protein
MSAVGAGLRREDSPVLRRRGLVVALVLLAIVAVAVLLFRGDGGYTVTAEFINAGQLVKGNEVKASGVTVGSVKSIDVTEDGHAKVELGISDGDYKPLRRGTQVMIKQASLSGIRRPQGHAGDLPSYSIKGFQAPCRGIGTPCSIGSREMAQTTTPTTSAAPSRQTTSAR